MPFQVGVFDFAKFAAIIAVAMFAAADETLSSHSFVPPRCEIVPLSVHQVSFQIDGVEKLRWQHGDNYPRPFFFPLNGPAGTPLTRMGHPGAPNHDHHQSIWFAHNSVNGLDFWGNGHQTTIRQKQWYAYRDGDDEAIMATVAGWFGPDGREIMEQETVAALQPLEHGEHALELQITLQTSRAGTPVELGQTNFGFLAVRVAKSLSAHFGGGSLTNSEGQTGEQNIFGKPARWMDYSGPVAVGEGGARTVKLEGITFFDHPQNPRHPTHWHVREDGWMGAAFCLQAGLSITPDSPLTLRYLLHAHTGPYDHDQAQRVQQAFSKRASFEVLRSKLPHNQYEVRRTSQ